ncbi:hypothetical protein BVY01_00475, partial [bacterium I07]
YKKVRKRVAFTVITILFIIFMLTLIFNRIPTETMPPMTTYRFTNLVGAEDDPSFSSDGRSIVFTHVGDDQNSWNIYIKLIDLRQENSVQLTNHSYNDYKPIWLLDNQNIIFSRSREPRKIYTQDYGIHQVSIIDGIEKELVIGDRPDLSPDGKYLVCSVQDSIFPWDYWSIYVFDLDSYHGRKLVDTPHEYYDIQPTISPDGKTVAFLRTWLFTDDSPVGDIYVVPFNGGEQEQVTSDSVRISGFDWTPDSKSLVISSARRGPYSLWKVSISNREVHPLLAGGNHCVSPTVSTDGKWLAYVELQNPSQSGGIFRYEIPKPSSAQKDPIRLARSGKRASYSPDGEYIVFESSRTGRSEIFVCGNDGSNPVQLTHSVKYRFSTPRNARWSPDSKWICFHATIEGKSQIFKINRDNSEVVRITHTNS